MSRQRITKFEKSIMSGKRKLSNFDLPPPLTFEEEMLEFSIWIPSSQMTRNITINEGKDTETKGPPPRAYSSESDAELPSYFDMGECDSSDSQYTISTRSMAKSKNKSCTSKSTQSKIFFYKV